IDRTLQERVRRGGPRRPARRRDCGCGRGKLARKAMPQPNINKMLKQVQQMQAEMMKAQEQLKDEEVEASAGGGMVTVKMSGDREVKETRIDPSPLGAALSPG